MTNRLIQLLLVITVVACQRHEKPERVIGVVADSAMVVSAHPLATQVGKTILQKGGNAIDASIATQFALAVVYPAAGNIGGGGFMVIRMNTGEASTLDYREKAPETGSTKMYIGETGEISPGLSE